jgi:hypothetical protein
MTHAFGLGVSRGAYLGYNLGSQSGMDGGGTSPASVANLFAWFTAKNPNGDSVLPASGTAISRWMDVSGNGNHTNTQGTAGKRAVLTYNQINGRPSMLFTAASTQTYALPAAFYAIPNGNSTLFYVAKRNTETGSFTNPLCMNEGGNTTTEARYYTLFSSVAGRVGFRSGTALNTQVNVDGGTNTTYQLITCQRSGTTQSISLNGGVAVTNTNGANENGVDRAFIGSLADTSNYLDGGIGEMILYNRALTAAEILYVQTYLKQQWSIP